MLIRLFTIFSMLAASQSSFAQDAQNTQDQYTLKVGGSFATYGLLVGISAQDPWQSGNHEAVLYKNGREIIRVPVNAKLIHSGLIVTIGHGFIPEFTIENLNPQMSFRSLLTEYRGNTLGVGTGGPYGSHGWIRISVSAPIKVRNGSQWVNLKKEGKSNGPFLFGANASYTTLHLELDRDRVTGPTPAALDQAIGTLEGPNPELMNKGALVRLFCMAPNDFATAPKEKGSSPLSRSFDLDLRIYGVSETGGSTEFVSTVEAVETTFSNETDYGVYKDPQNVSAHNPYNVNFTVDSWRYSENVYSLHETAASNRTSAYPRRSDRGVMSTLYLSSEYGKVLADIDVRASGLKFKKEKLACNEASKNTRLNFSEFLAEFVKYRGWYR